MNLKSISAMSMPDSHTLLRSSHLFGPKVLQVNHSFLYFSLFFLVLCLVAEKIDKEKEKLWSFLCVLLSNGLGKGRCQKQNGGFFEEFESSAAFDALRSLTTATAVEYSHTPAISDDVVPETKVCLEGKVTVRNGIVCLSPKVVTLLGGVVQSLYEEWQMNTKYSEFSRSTFKDFTGK
ncbi:hypothetical protein C1H46_023925 [Malus baccata]|uniref:RecQ mediated genome instability protein 1 OB-fold domain-containing protein n=1 Tax=Malus baccata TaxID=106549 RepID=A0A540LVH6_MALBA|nr:hypothetical protein C1H46_023925 [Malus baccata]